MSTITFDTLKYVDRLEKAGVPREHAKAEAEALAEVLDANSVNLATQNDVLRLELKIAETKTDLIRWVVGVGMLQTTLIAALLIRLMPK